MLHYKEVPREDEKKRFARLLYDMKLRPHRTARKLSENSLTRPLKQKNRKRLPAPVKKRQQSQPKKPISIHTKVINEKKEFPLKRLLSSTISLRNLKTNHIESVVSSSCKVIDEEISILYEKIVKPTILTTAQSNVESSTSLTKTVESSQKLWFERPVILALDKSIPSPTSSINRFKTNSCKMSNVVIDLC